jgi:hypothetical protein
MRVFVLRMTFGDYYLFLFQGLSLEHFHDSQGDFILDGKNIVSSPVKPL